MGVKEQQRSAQVQRQEANLNKLNEELKLDLAQSAIDIAGIVDPTPISDLTGAGLSLYRGDFIGAGLSLISIVPYAGDALGKTAKGARLAKKMAGLKKKIAAAVVAVEKARAAKFIARKKGAAALRAKQQALKAKEFAKAKKCPPCKQPSGNRFGTKSPAEGSYGTWKGAEKGNSEFYPDPKSERGQAILKATGGKPIKFKDGYPDFSPHAMDLPGGGKARVEINMQGNNSSDYTAARNAIRTKLNDPNWTKPKGWTWHHHQDGVTMELVPSNLNNKVTHNGGDSLVRELKKDPGY